MIPTWTTAMPDWADRIKRGESIIPPPIFPDEAERGLAVFRELKIVDAPGSPTIGESCAPWIFELAASIFGAYDAESGRRLITEWFVCVPKKNSKSTIAAAIMQTALLLNWRQSAEFTLLAPTIEIASNAFAPARDMVKHDEELEELIQVQTHVRTLTHRITGATLKVIAADSNTVGGKKSVGTLIDELWLFGKQLNAENMFREALGGLASRPEGFVIYLTTQSDDPPSGVFKQKLQYARDVRDGKINDQRFVPIIFEHPPDMVAKKQHLLAENLALVNPNIGYSIDREFLEREYNKAKAGGEESFRGFLAKHGNVEIGMSLRADRWAGADFWQQQADKSLTLDGLLRRSEVVDVGIDGGGLDDMLGLCVVGREAGTEGDRARWLVWNRAWINRIVLERRKSEAARFADFAADGDLVICDEVGQDVEDIAELVANIERLGLLDKVGIDPAGIGSLLDGLIAAGITAERIVGISQGWRLGGAIKTTERKLAEGKLWHGGARIMDWCVGNAKVEPRGNAILITKQASGYAKIDPLMAAFNAVSLMALNPESAGKSFWETETA